MATKYNLSIEQGASFYLKLTWKSATNQPINTTGYTGKMQIRNRVGGTILSDMTTENNKIKISSAGVIELKLPASDTNQIKTNGVYDLQLISPSGEITRFLEGEVKISLAVTQ